MTTNTPAVQAMIESIRQRANAMGLAPDVDRRPAKKKAPGRIQQSAAAEGFLSISSEEASWNLMCPVEDTEQEAIFQWMNNHPDKRLLKAFAIPNGTYKNRRSAVKHQQTGLKSGIPDIMVPIAIGGYHGLFIEMKRRKGGQLSSNQKDRIAGLLEEGYMVVTCKGWHSAQRAITEYLNAQEKA
jgi:hypothetical protein